MQLTWTNLIHSFKTHCFNCMKQSCRLQVIFYLKKFCSLNINSIKFLMSRSNRCHKSVWIYYYYLIFNKAFILILFTNSFFTIFISTDNKIHLYMMLITNLLILFCVQIEVKRVKRSQFDTVQMMLERCVIRKVNMQSFHSCDNIFPNSHNRFMKKINDMSMSVRDEKILLVKKTTQMKSLRVVITSDRRICNSSTALILKHLHHINNVVE